MHEVWNTCSSVSKVDVSWLSAFKMNTIEISWSVKGYHYFKVKPNPGEVMQVRREYNNPVDPNAMSRHAVVHLTVSHLRVYRTVYGIHIPHKVRFMSITDKVRYIRIADKVRYTRNTDFVYNGQKTLVPTGTLYARFTVLVKMQSKRATRSLRGLTVNQPGVTWNE